jgi:hypothetical protein
MTPSSITNKGIDSIASSSATAPRRSRQTERAGLAAGLPPVPRPACPNILPLTNNIISSHVLSASASYSRFRYCASIFVLTKFFDAIMINEKINKEINVLLQLGCALSGGQKYGRDR